MLRYIASSKINNKPLTDTKYDFSIIVEKIENWIGRTVHGPFEKESVNFLDPTGIYQIQTFWNTCILVYTKKLGREFGEFSTVVQSQVSIINWLSWILPTPLVISGYANMENV